MLLNSIGLNTSNAWDKVYLEVKRSTSGIYTIYIKGDKTYFKAGGCGTVLADFLAYYTGDDEYLKYGCSGTREIINKALQSTKISLEYITSLKDGELYLLKKIN